MIKSNFQSPESLVLRFMREKKQLTLLLAGKKSGLKPKNIDYMECGRRVITQAEILLLLSCYNFSLEVFNEMLKIKPLNKQAANHYFLTRT
mgnify:CR=1 FL=1|jgi:hypothetical protein